MKNNSEGAVYFNGERIEGRTLSFGEHGVKIENSKGETVLEEKVKNVLGVEHLEAKPKFNADNFKRTRPLIETEILSAFIGGFVAGGLIISGLIGMYKRRK